MPKISINNIELHYNQYGNGKGVVILLHGFLSSSRMWEDDYIHDLMKTYTVYTIDMRGHGNSHNVKSGCNLFQMADDVYQFAVKKNIEKCIIGGMSMGGGIAIQFAINFPEKVESLLLITPGPGTLISNGPGSLLLSGPLVSTVPVLSSVPLIASVPVLSKAISLLLPLVSLLMQKTNLFRHILESGIINPLPEKALSDFTEDAALISTETWCQYADPANIIYNLEKLKTLATPALVLIAEDDRLAPMKFQEDVAAFIPNASKVILENEQHSVVMHNSKRVLSEINNFLNMPAPRH